MSSSTHSNPLFTYNALEPPGSRVLANCDIPQGAMILSTYPLICSPISQRIPSICHYCFKRFRTLSRCSRCKLVRYCSKQCQVADWKYHKVECPVFKILSNMVDVDPTSVIARDILLYRFAAIDHEGASIRDYDSLESSSEKNQLLVKATTMDLLDLMKDFDTDSEQTCEETNISIWLQGLIGEVEEKSALPDEDEIILMYKVMKNKEIPIYADNEQIGVGIYPFVSSCAFSEDPNTCYQYDGNRLLLFAGRAISKGEPLTFPFCSCSYPLCIRDKLFHERYIDYSFVDEDKKRPGYLMGLVCPHGHRIQPESADQNQHCAECDQDYEFMFPVNRMNGLDYEVMLSDFNDFYKQGRCSDAIVRDAERELDEDNYILFLLYKACRDHYILKENYEFAEYHACRVVHYEKTYQPDLKRELVNDLLILAYVFVRSGSIKTAISTTTEAVELMQSCFFFSEIEIKRVIDIRKKWEMGDMMLSYLDTY